MLANCGNPNNTAAQMQSVIHDWHGDISVREPMPKVYAREMLGDWRGAGLAITGKDNTIEWYKTNCEFIKLHPATRGWIEEQLGYVDEAS